MAEPEGARESGEAHPASWRFLIGNFFCGFGGILFILWHSVLGHVRTGIITSSLSLSALSETTTY